MARGYVGVNGKARKLRAIYVGVNGKARSVKAVYVGVNGKARLCWRRPGVYKHTGALDPLTIARYNLKAAHVGDKYALFAGGYTGSRYKADVDAYSSELVHTNPSSLISLSSNGFAASNGKRAFFCGGVLSSTSLNDAVNYYGDALTRNSAVKLSTARYRGASASVGNYVLFAGGDAATPASSGITPSKVVDGYSVNLHVGKMSSVAPLSSETYNLAGASLNGKYALFAGGATSRNDLKIVHAYDSSLTKTKMGSSSSLRVARHSLTGGSVGKYAIFVGGSSYSITSGTTTHGFAYSDAYNDSLTKVTIKDIPYQETDKSAASLYNNKYVLFFGGYTRSNSKSDVVVMYDENLTMTYPSSLKMSYSANYMDSTCVGNYIITAGGLDSSAAVKYSNAWYYEG